MKAMILAAGKGTRVQPITHDIPKPMIPLVRKPILESIIEHLKGHGVDELAINTSHLAPEIENYFRDGNQFGVNIGYSFEGTICDGEIKGMALGSAGGMRKIQDFSGFFNDTFIVLCGDALIDLDISRLLEFHRERKAIATIALKEVPLNQVEKYGVVQTDGSGRIMRFQEKPHPSEAVSRDVNTGIYIFEPEIFNYIPSGVEYDIGSQLFPALVEAGEHFYGISLPFNWLDIGSVPDFWGVNRAVLLGKVEGYRLPGKEVRPGVRLGINVDIDLDKVEIEGPVYIGSSTRIGNGSRIIGPTVIGTNCVIEPGATIEECLVDDYTRVSRVARLRHCMVYGGRIIQKDGSFVDCDETDIGWIVEDARKEISLSESHQMLHDLALESRNKTMSTTQLHCLHD